MFAWKIKPDNLDPVFRVIYTLQLIAVAALFGGFFLVWWDSADPQNLWPLLERSTRELRARSPRMIFQPLLLLWLLWPSLLLSTVRSVLGLVVQPISFRRLALWLWGASVLPLVHYVVNYGESLSAQSPLREGTIGIGFWLTASATGILGGLLLVENLIRAPEQVFMPPEAPARIDDAEALWEGNYRVCPFCGTLNAPDAKACFNCRNLLFSFGPDS